MDSPRVLITAFAVAVAAIVGISPTPAAAGATGITDAEAITVGLDTTCVTRPDGSAACWGRNELGQLGRGTQSTFETTPAPVTVIGHPIASAVTNESTTCVLAADATAECWGYTLGGQLGVLIDGPSAPPVRWGAGDLR